MTSGGLRRRVLASALSLGMMGGVQAIAASPTFAAMPTPPASCNWGDTFWSIGNTAKPYAITHAAGVTIPPHWTYSNTSSLQLTASITATVTGTVTGTTEANLIIGKVGGSVSLQLQLSGSFTAQGTVSDTWSHTNTSSTSETFILYTAPHKVTASWQKWQCTRWDAWSMTESGTVTSWDIEYKGVADCAASYTSGTAQALAKSRYCP